MALSFSQADFIGQPGLGRRRRTLAEPDLQISLAAFARGDDSSPFSRENGALRKFGTGGFYPRGNLKETTEAGYLRRKRSS
jgi:hypothetical protein